MCILDKIKNYYKIEVGVHTIDDVKSFCNHLNNLDCKVIITDKDENYVINGKSILGIFSLDLSKNMYVYIPFEDVLNVNKEIGKWIIENEE